MTPTPPLGFVVQGPLWIGIDRYDRFGPVSYGFTIIDTRQPYQPEHSNRIMHFRCIEVSDGGCKSEENALKAARRWIARHGGEQ